MNAFCSGCGFSGVPRPSMVTTLPFTDDTGTEHERIGRPSMCTVHAPHCASPQPNFGPFSSSSLRSTYRSGVSGAALTACGLPLTVMVAIDWSPSARHRGAIETVVVVLRGIGERLLRLAVLAAQLQDGIHALQIDARL